MRIPSIQLHKPGVIMKNSLIAGIGLLLGLFLNCAIYADTSGAGKLSDGPSGGYSYYDSYEPLGPDFLWDPLKDSLDADYYELKEDQMGNNARAIGFTFQFFDRNYSNIYISSEGFITFTANQHHGCCDGTRLPSNSGPDNLIAGLWDDLDPDKRGYLRNSVFTATRGVAPNRFFIIEFFEIPHTSYQSILNTFQIVLYEGSNDIIIHYKDITSLGKGSTTAGIENLYGNAGLQYPRFDTEGNYKNLSVLYTTADMSSSNPPIESDCEGAELCTDCPDSSCDVSMLCPTNPANCMSVQPCNVVFNTCDCGFELWQDGDYIGVTIQSLTSGVYVSSGNISLKLFKELNNNEGGEKNPDDACDYLDTGSMPGPWDYVWSQPKYLDVDGQEIISPDLTSYYDCELVGNEQVDSITTCTLPETFILDNADNYDDDGDGLFGEDENKPYALLRTPQFAVNWPEVEAAGLMGTTAQATVCLLNMTPGYCPDHGYLCDDCEILCCCSIDVVELCGSNYLTAQIDTPSSAVSIQIGESINFTGTGIGGSAPYIYWWNFQKNGSSTLEDPGNILFNSVGTYMVTFWVRDSLGSLVSDSITVTVTGAENPLVAQIDTPSINTTVSQNQSVAFTGSVTGGQMPYFYWWDFAGAGGSALEDPGVFTFTWPATYPITFWVQDSLGNVANDTAIVTVTAPATPLSVAIDTPASAMNITKGDSVNFSCTPSGGSPYYTYWWNFLSEGYSVHEDPGSITFNKAGVYEVLVYVQDSLGTVVWNTVTINVNAPANCTDISGSWTASETVHLRCCMNGIGCESDVISGSDTVTIQQDGCNISYNIYIPDYGNISRTGTITGNAINFSGIFVVLQSGCHATLNNVDMTGTVNGNQITLYGSGIAEGYCSDMSASCTGSSTALLTRSGTSSIKEASAKTNENKTPLDGRCNNVSKIMGLIAH